jgi:hypothetical protein
VCCAFALTRGSTGPFGPDWSWQASEDTNLNPSNTPALAFSFSRRTIAVILAGLVGLATAFLILTGGSGGTIAHAATVSVKASSLTDHECDATEWHFVITQLDSEAAAPDTIHVVWTNGEEADVPLAKFTGKTAHYVTTLNLDSTVVDATAVLPDGWSGQFNLSHGPCGPTPTAPPSPTSPPPSQTS